MNAHEENDHIQRGSKMADPADHIEEKTVASDPQVIENAKVGDYDVIIPDWSPKEETKIKRKLDMIIMPLVMLGLFALQLDKGNIANALTDTIVEDLGMQRDEINSGNQLQLAAIIAFEIPCNMILAKVGAARWLTFEAFAWGMVATFQAFITNKPEFYATRFLLGLFEAGYLPGSMTILSDYYTRSEIAMRTTLLYAGNYLAQGLGSVIAAGVFQLAGAHGLSGWQWLFIIDGSFTVFVAFVFFFFLPNGPSQTQPVCGIKWFNLFTDRERHIMSRRVIVDDPRKKVALTSISFKEACRILMDFRLWAHAGINIVSLVPKGGLQLYSPTILRELGFSKLRANAFASIPYYGVIVLSVIAAWVSDKTRQRGLVCLICSAYAIIFAGAQYGLTTSDHKWTRFAIFTLLNSGNAIAQGINDAWLASNTQDPKSRALGLALCIMGSNIGGLSGQQLFRQSDAPRYTSGFLAVMCLYAGSMGLIAVVTLWYWRANRKTAKANARGEQLYDRNGALIVKYDI